MKLIKDTVSVLSRQQKLSIWVEGAYGTGKSYAVLTLKKLLDANEKDTKAYFEKYNLDNDLLNKFQGEKNSGKILTVHRYGSASIRGDNDLVLAIQESIEKALNSEGIENQGPNTLKNAIIKWLSDTDNKHFFNALITGSYSKLFCGDTVDIIINKLQTYTDDALQTLMDQIFKVAKERQINAFTLTTTDLCNWIKEIIKANGLKAIVFIWDEFTEYFNNTIINEYSVILQDVDAVKNYLYEKVGTEPYLWLGIPEVKKKIQQLAEAQYNKNGYEKALAKIDKMDTEDVKSYIKKLIKDDMILGIQIIKNSH